MQQAQGHTQRNGEIEVIRFVLAVLIVFYHMGFFLGWSGAQAVVPRGYLAVELFYLLTGYFLCRSWKRRPTHLVPFLVKRVKSFYPELAVSLFLSVGYCLLMAVPPNGHLSLLKHTFVEEVLLLKMTGIVPHIHIGTANGPIWYLSSMLLATVVLYICNRFRRADVVLPVLSMSLFFWLLHVSGGKIGNPYNKTCGIYWGNLRALSEMGMGMCAYTAVCKLKTLNWGKRLKGFPCIIKYILFAALLGYMFTGRPHMPLVWMLGAWLWLVIAMGGTSNESKVFSGKLPQLLGKISLPLYLSHCFYAYRWNAVMPESMPILGKVGCYLLAGCITTALVMAGAHVIRCRVALFRARE